MAMNFRICLTGEAVHDLESIMDYIARDAPKRAEAHVDALLGKIRSLKSMPRRCAHAPENGWRGYELRHLIYGDYRILFTLAGETVTVLRIIHGAKMLDYPGN